jgi:UDP-2-acetamido-2,6-beta-L-arabino-hexul-4-ose reductase
MRIAITGASGFIGRNLRVRLTEAGLEDVVCVSHDLADDDLCSKLAGVNRPPSPAEFANGNTGFTRRICSALASVAPHAAIVFSSSTQAVLENEYGRSKRDAEDVLLAHGHATGVCVTLLRLTNVFGKWSKPNYNSAVATFCHNIGRDLPITINDPAATLKLIYVDDVVDCLVAMADNNNRVSGFVEAKPVYDTNVGEVATIIRSFRESRVSLVTPPVGTGLTRALYSTYVAGLEPEQFVYDIPMYSDPRGTFSYFTAHPGITRGEHYHHSKTEKFLVLKGTAEFGFRHIETNQRHVVVTSGDKAQIVETVPGWTHNITNIGDDEMIVMLWANEIFDRERPDTIAMKV